jgi:SAM-dependent methyltransferase
VTLPLAFLKALADPVRFRLAGVLSRHELSVNEIVGILDMGQSRVSRHLTILAQSGIAQSRREGLSVYYRVSPDGPARSLLEALEGLAVADPAARETAEADLRRATEVVRERGARTRRFFDTRAGEWDRLARDLLGDLDLGAVVVELLDRLPVRPAVAVDIGCGTGALMESLAPRVDRTIGVDSSPRMLERARRRFEGRDSVELRLGEAEHLPLGDGEADLALMSMTLHHLAEPRAGLGEVARVTRPGGAFILVELEGHRREELREEQADRWLGFDRDEVRDMARAAGLTLEEQRSVELPKGLRLGTYLFALTNGGERDGQRKDLRGS